MKYARSATPPESPYEELRRFDSRERTSSRKEAMPLLIQLFVDLRLNTRWPFS